MKQKNELKFWTQNTGQPTYFVDELLELDALQFDSKIFWCIVQ